MSLFLMWNNKYVQGCKHHTVSGAYAVQLDMRHHVNFTLTEFKCCLFSDQSKHFASREMWPNLNFIFQRDLKPTFRFASLCAAADTQQVFVPPGGRYMFRRCSLGSYFFTSSLFQMNKTGKLSLAKSSFCLLTWKNQNQKQLPHSDHSSVQTLCSSYR